MTYFNLENADLTEQWVKGVEFESVAPVTNTAYTAQKNSLAVPLIDANNSDFENAQLKGSSTGGSQYGDEKKKRKKLVTLKTLCMYQGLTEKNDRLNYLN